MLLSLTIFLSYIGSLPFGMINLNVLYAGLRQGRKQALYMALGAAVIELIQGFVAALVYSRLVHFSSYEYLFRWAATAVFIGLAIYYFVKQKKQIEWSSQKIESSDKPFLKGVFLSSLNFMAIPFWLIIIAMISNYIQINWQWLDMLIFGIGAGIGGFLSSFTYVLIGRKFISETSLVYKYLDYGLAALFFILAVVSILL